MSDSKVKPRYSILQNIRFVWKGLVRFDRTILPFVAAGILMSSVLHLLPVVMPKLIIDELTLGHDWQRFIALVVGFAVAGLVLGSLRGLSGNNISGRMIVARMRFMVEQGKKFMGTGFQNLERPEVLDMAQKATRAMDNNMNGIEGIMHRVEWCVGKLLTLAGTMAIISLLHPLLILFFLFLTVINALVGYHTRLGVKVIDDELAPVWRKLWYVNSVMTDFEYAKDIRLFGFAGFLESKLKAEQDHRLDAQMRQWGKWLRFGIVASLTGFVQELAMYVWLVVQVANQAIGIGDFVMYVAAIQLFNNNLRGILDDLDHIRQQNAVLNDYRAFLDLEDPADAGTRNLADLGLAVSAVEPGMAGQAGLAEVAAGQVVLAGHADESAGQAPGTGQSGQVGQSGVPVPPVPTVPQVPPRFEFRKVGFTYQGQDTPALQEVDLVIEPGERLAVVGLNGAGKSTFIKLLTRLYEPGSGEILANGIAARDFRRDEWFGLFAPVFQEIRIFPFLLKENVALEESAVLDRDRVARAVAAAGLDGRVASLEKGLDHPVTKQLEDDGVEFSGGEQQKLALARALYKNAPVLVLDEPTSALDALAEARLYQDFDALSRGKTAIYVSHRLASTRFCDRILVFDGGRIVEEGTHEGLLVADGQYARLFRVQSENYLQDQEVQA